MQGYTGLRSLVFAKCGGLISLFPILKCLTTLEVLYIENCENLDLVVREGSQEEFTMSLQVLCISELPQLEVLPQWIKWPARTLQHMTIQGCPNLEALPNLESLAELAIVDCPKLLSLPVCLPVLRFFTISECPKLSRSCQLPIGKNWHKIAHASEI